MAQKTHAGASFMHEAFHKDEPKKFTQSWLRRTDTIFDELVLKTNKERPYLFG
jgi:meiotically up-regulated gene 157 (Mug157) protein